MELSAGGPNASPKLSAGAIIWGAVETQNSS